MKIVFWASTLPGTLEASVNGDVLTVNGERFDLSPITEGMQLPGSAMDNDWFPAHFPITRQNGELTVTLRLPVQYGTPESVTNPETPLYVVVTKGKVTLPDTAPAAVEAPIIEPSEEPVRGPEPT